MRNRGSQFDMAHAFPADTGLGDFNAAAVADHALVADLLVLSAGALPVLGRTENAFAEQTSFSGFWER